ncbi:MAG: methylmalonyl Co-A mutase-associated GTPase MeaB [Myxococcales bacterium]|nr:methylmalonyl Co-A mutase-associated GTPase MeaB [Myxococcales bacterium]
MAKLSVDAYVRGIERGDRALLARAITLVESEQPRHAALGQEVLERLLPRTGRASRVGVSGVPGVGKSTFIDALGMHLIEQGHRVAALTLDPSSTVTGGSILGDKTRMTRLSREADAYIRPSPTGGTLGGVGRKTRETMLLCEAFGFDVVIVETVGVGQSETVVAEMVDFYLVLMLAGAGDELQGIKRGILEVADMLAINKADGDNRVAAKRARSDYAAALKLMHRGQRGWKPPVLMCSALHDEGLDAIWEKVQEHRAQLSGSGALQARRADQAVRWMWRIVEDALSQALRRHPDVRARLGALERDVREGRATASAAARQILDAFGAGA